MRVVIAAVPEITILYIIHTHIYIHQLRHPVRCTSRYAYYPWRPSASLSRRKLRTGKFIGPFDFSSCATLSTSGSPCYIIPIFCIVLTTLRLKLIEYLIGLELDNLKYLRKNERESERKNERMREKERERERKMHCVWRGIEAKLIKLSTLFPAPLPDQIILFPDRPQHHRLHRYNRT